jgi:hypothetical protein
MKLNRTQKILLGTAITGVGAYFLYKYLFPADQESDQESEPDKKDTGVGTGLVVLPGNTGVVPLPVILPTLKVGDYVNAKNNTGVYSSNTLANRYPMGNVKGILSGTLLKGYYAGKIKKIDVAKGSAQLENYTYKARDSDENDYPLYWVKFKDLELK